MGYATPPEGDTTGWYIWAGEEFSDDFTPSLVDYAIRHGQATTGASGRVGYYSATNNVTVILENGRVVTVTSGTLKIR